MPKGSRWEEIIKTIPESNEIESSKATDLQNQKPVPGEDQENRYNSSKAN